MKTTIALFSVVLAFISVTVSPTIQAVDPPPDGGYPNENTAEGEDALFNLSADGPGQNSALGFNAMFNTTYGSLNTAIGDMALFSNTTGPGNTAVGHRSLYSNVSSSNTAIGIDALFSNTTGTSNVGIGDDVMFFSTTGDLNTAVGSLAMTASGTGSYNTALGAKTLALNSTGHDNTAVGYGALNYNDTGINNVAVGSFAGSTYGTSGSNNILLGYAAGLSLATGSNNIEIGNPGDARDARVIRIGDPATQKQTFIAGIAGTAIAAGVVVGVNAKGQLGVRASSARFKEGIKPMDKASEAILALKPVTFRYKKELDPESVPQFGLVAEDVAKVNPGLVARNTEGEVYTVRYEAVNAMLLNEFLKEHRKGEEQDRKIQQQEMTIAELRREMKVLAATVNEQASELRKVSAQLHINTAAAQTIAENP